MDADEFTATVREECERELDRLGSEKALVAATAARLDREHVLASAARAELRAVETFESWAASESAEAARAAFVDAAEREREHADRVVALLDEDVEPDPDADPLHEYLRGLDSTAERVAAGMVGRPMVTDRTLLQTINFFVNESDERTADRFRELRGETREMVEEGARLLEEVCEGDDDWERAEEAAVEVVERAYEEYAETLEGMGVDPRPVC
ncbi:rubrerythrin family protein [Halomarina pelagica]|uniref:rubrerythrin family protein n=1 Tax=Halomarina pelagica TaxID=2961599 RepID=UPI0020C508FF|nr:rubrerythrin family protein [Halomarina sp. BND7]